MPLLDAPVVLLQHMLTFLPISDRLVAARSCRVLEHAASAAHVWTEPCEVRMLFSDFGTHFLATPFVSARAHQTSMRDVPGVAPHLQHPRTMDHAQRLEMTARSDELYLTREERKQLRRGQCPWMHPFTPINLSQPVAPSIGFLMRFAPLELHVKCQNVNDARIANVMCFVDMVGPRLRGIALDPDNKTNIALPREKLSSEPLTSKQCCLLLVSLTDLVKRGRLRSLSSFSMRQMTVDAPIHAALIDLLGCAALQRLNLSACHFTPDHRDAATTALARVLAQSPCLRTVVMQASVDMPRVLLLALEQQANICVIDMAYVALNDEFFTRFGAVAHRLEVLRLSDREMEELSFRQTEEAQWNTHDCFFHALVSALDHPQSRLRAVSVVYGGQVNPPRKHVRALAEALQRVYARHGTTSAEPDYPDYWDGRLLEFRYHNTEPAFYSLNTEESGEAYAEYLGEHDTEEDSDDESNYESDEDMSDDQNSQH